MTNHKWAVEIIESNMEGYTPEERSSFLSDLQQHGCISGMVGGVIYHSETNAIFKEHMEDILETIAEYDEETGYNVIEHTVNEGNTETLPNYLVWFIIEQEAAEMLEKEVA